MHTCVVTKMGQHIGYAGLLHVWRLKV